MAISRLFMSYSKPKLVVAFLLAVLVSFLGASVFHSQFVLNELVLIGVEIPLTTRISTTLSDLAGMAPGYGPIILIGLLLGFVIIGQSRRWVSWPAVVAYPVGGILAFLTMHILMRAAFDISVVAGARTFAGLTFQCLAGAIGGWLFAKSLAWARKRPQF